MIIDLEEKLIIQSLCGGKILISLRRVIFASFHKSFVSSWSRWKLLPAQSMEMAK